MVAEHDIKLGLNGLSSDREQYVVKHGCGYSKYTQTISANLSSLKSFVTILTAAKLILETAHMLVFKTVMGFQVSRAKFRPELVEIARRVIKECRVDPSISLEPPSFPVHGMSRSLPVSEAPWIP